MTATVSYASAHTKHTFTVVYDSYYSAEIIAIYLSLNFNIENFTLITTLLDLSSTNNYEQTYKAVF